eukprot:CAMPEP_0170451500 /NCGR_PEP_ID=MMETSP0123-20130129/719_1 /TAXON_ID=182087 /ORGANISM="Favella ehrenbergii, Strain Fehren 1" /LENGTH=283 /DNA_ID=CAMNT_0010713209 /DNA_START=210 /DNA_END=1061 /DNA_ORIENTATION=-
MTGVAAQYAGPSLFLSFLFAGGIAMTTAMMLAELSSRIRTNGSAFSYTYATMGELPAWVVGWNLNLRYGLCSAGLARGMTSYFVGLFAKFGAPLPTWMYSMSFFGAEKCSILSIIFLLVLHLIYIRGTEESKIFNMVFTVLKLLTLLFIIVVALAKFDSDNFSPFVLDEHDGWAGSFYATTLIFYGYTGFDIVTTLTQEAQKPSKNVPLAIKASSLICMCLYALTAFALYGMAPLQNFNAETAMADAFASVGLEKISFVVYFCAFFGITAACFTNLISQPRIL